MANRLRLNSREMNMIRASFDEGLRGKQRRGRDLARDVWLWLWSWSRFRNRGDGFEKEKAQRARAEFVAGLNGDGTNVQTSEGASQPLASEEASGRDLSGASVDYRKTLEQEAAAEFREALHRKGAGD